jgi:hypothetical protein
LVGQGDQVIGIGAVSQEDAQAVTLEGAGLDDGSRLGETRMSLGKLANVGDRAGPQAVELLAQLTLQMTE